MHVIEVPFHIGDFLSGTIHMDAEQTGAYIMLIVAHYNAGEKGLPNDDAQLARIARVTPKAWKRIKPILAEKFTISEHFWVQEKCKKVLQKIQEKSNAAKDNALKRHNTPHADAQPPQCNGYANHPTTKPVKKEPPKSPKGDGSLNPSDFGKGVFSVEPKLTDDGLMEARRRAPGWDIYFLMRTYDEGVNSGAREPPKHADKAFPAWCANYTKGKPP